MNFTENSKEIVLRYIPVREWISGAILTIIFIAVCIWLSNPVLTDPLNFFKSLVNEWTDITFPLIILVTIILIDIKEIKSSLVSFTFQRKVTASKETKSVDFLRHDIFGSKTERFYFSQIEKFKSYKAAVCCNIFMVSWCV